MEGLWNGYGISLFSGVAEERHCRMLSIITDRGRKRRRRALASLALKQSTIQKIVRSRAAACESFLGELAY